MNRNRSIDFAKGLLIIGVTYGHIVSAFLDGDAYTPWLYTFVRSYDMPMFAFISGILLVRSTQRHTVAYNILQKICLTIVPAVIWEVVIWGGVLRSFPVPFGSIWYLWSIGIVFLVMLITIRVFQNVSEIITYIFFAIEIVLFHTIIKDPFNVGFLLFPACVGFVMGKESILGFDLKNELNIKKHRVSFESLFFVFVLMEIFWKMDYSVWNNTCDLLSGGVMVSRALLTIYRGLLGVVGSIVMFSIFDLIYKMASHRKDLIKMIDLVITFGESSEQLYILQCLFVSVFGTIAVHRIVQYCGFNPFLVNKFIMGYVLAPIMTILSLLFMQLVGTIIRKTPYIGKGIFGIRLSSKKIDLEFIK